MIDNMTEQISDKEYTEHLRSTLESKNHIFITFKG